jgi:hypothetical protein
MPDLSFRATLKNPRVEEPIDIIVHRPLGYLVARLAYPTRVSPDALTIVSMLLGVAAAIGYASPVLGHGEHLELASMLFVASAVLDCSDGQLARMRGTSTKFGRMLDGVVDAVVQATVVPAALAHMLWRLGGLESTEAIVWGVLGVAAIYSGIRHTALYDHFKNVYVRNTDPKPRDCDDLDLIEAEWRRVRAAGSVPIGTRIRYGMYIYHLRSIDALMRWVDPFVPSRFRDMPAYSPERAARFRRLNDGLMRAWSFFGIGTHIFLLAACTFFDQLEWYVVLRLVVFNGALAMLVPMQRRASRRFFEDSSRADERPEPAVA